MYSDISIETLETRIGWEKSLDTDFAIELDEEVLTANSERKVNSFHQLVTVDNVYAAVNKTDMEAVEFNGFLSSVRRQSVKEVLTLIFDQNASYDEVVDYSNLIISKPRLFDDVIGYSIAIKMLELFISSSRNNLLERNSKLSFQNLKLELEGVRNDKGFYITKAQKVIFPLEVIVTSGKTW
jgi:hypothetical protein